MLFTDLVSLQRVFTGKCLPAAAVAQKRSLTGVRVPMAFQIVLSIE